MTNEIYFYGDEDEIKKIIDFFKANCTMGDKGIYLVDINPDLTKKYMEANFIERE